MEFVAEGVHDRFKDAVWYKQKSVVVGGAGGIGSWLSLFLSRIGHNLYVYDYDRIEESNLGGQFYKNSDVGMTKTASLISNLQEFGSGDVYDMGRFEENSMTANIAFSCFDRMDIRKTFVTAWQQYQDNKSLRKSSEVNVLIDGRMEAQTGIIYVLNSPKRVERWMDEWFDDTKVEDAPCTFRATTHNAAILAGYMVAAFNNVVANKVEGMKMYEVPYKISYQLPVLMYQTER